SWRAVIEGPPVCAVSLRDDPVAAITASEEYAATVSFFTNSGAPSLLSAQARALLYQVIRLLRPVHVVEIGCLRGGATEALARALAADGRGTVHAVEPFTARELRQSIRRWPRALRAYVTVHPTYSMDFFMRLPTIRAGVYLIDGNHDYEYAAFDIE